MKLQNQVLVLLITIMLFAGCRHDQTRSGTVPCSHVNNILQTRNPAVEKRIHELIGKMSLAEKVGQMAQVTVGVVSKSGGKAPLVLDMKKLGEIICDYHVGSILNCDNVAISKENWREVITGIQDLATKKTRLGIPVIYGLDAIHGANYITGATIFPQSFAMAATGNIDLVKKSGEITAYELRAAGIPWNFNPVLGLAREPLWPRFYETYGEDPFLASACCTAYVNGLQGNNIGNPTRVAACMKHYLGYSVPHSGKDRTPALIPERDLRDYFILPFKAAVDAGIQTVMVNSSEINGIPIHSSRFYLTDLLRGELGFDGFVVTDWEDIINLYKRECVAVDEKDAIRMAINAGIDMSMIPYDYKSFCTKLIDLVKDGAVTEARINEAVRNILKVKINLGLFENPYPRKGLDKGFASEASRQVNLQAAREAITLLKNEKDLLPLEKDQKILITGPTANKLSCLNGGWTITWQGDREELYPQEKKTILEAITDTIGRENVNYVEGVTFDKEINIPEAVKAAGQADTAILCVGEHTYCESVGNINDLTLSAPQLKLINAIAKTGKPIVLVLVEGRPRVINSIVNNVQAIVMAYLPGLEGGIAVSDILFGDVNPSGKLPFTYPRYASGFVPYNHKPSASAARFEPQWTFGHGLSYTTFKYDNLKLDKTKLALNDTLKVSADVTNTGDLTGKEIVQLYVRDMVGSVTRPVRELKGFKKITLKPGQSKTVTFILSTADLRFHNRQMDYVVEPGNFKIWIGPGSENGLEGSFAIE